MQRQFPLSLTLLVLALSLLGLLGSVRSSAEERPTSPGDLLAGLSWEFDRGSFSPNVTLSDGKGRDKPGVRCATRPVGALERELVSSAVEGFVASAGTGHRSVLVDVPVYFHVVRNGRGAWNVSDSRLRRQIDVLNDSFAGRGFSFTLAGVRRYRNSMRP